MGGCPVAILITQQHIDMARKAGACSVKYKVGQPITDVSASDLKWMQEKFPAESESLAVALAHDMKFEVRGKIALAIFGYGDGDGYGDGYGEDYGYGDGEGDGYGYGDGDGYGYGADLVTFS
jgi:hypothetical protein